MNQRCIYGLNVNLHEVILPILSTVLVIGLFRICFLKHLIICMILLPLLFLPFFSYSSFFFLLQSLLVLPFFILMRSQQTYPLKSCSLIFLPQSLQQLLFLHGKIWELLNFGLIETVDNRILSLRNQDSLHLRNEFQQLMLERFSLVRRTILGFLKPT